MFTFGAGSKGQLGHGLALAQEAFPRLLKPLARLRRDVQQVTCGNNCTLILAGAFRPPTLLRKCMEVIRSTPGLMAHLGKPAT